MFFVYSIFNNLNGKIYIGKTNDPHRRWIKHKTTANCKNAGGRFYLHRAMYKDGVDNFTFTVFQTFEREEDCNAAEIYWIQFFNCRDEKLGYNLTNGGEGVSGRKDSDETREKKRLKAIGRKHTPETLEKMTGENCHSSKLTSVQIKEIRENYKTNKQTFVYLSEKYNVSTRAISCVIYNIDWIDENYIPPKPRSGDYYKKKLTDDDILQIRELLSQNIDEHTIAKKFKITRTNVCMIKNHETWRNNVE